MKNKIVEMVPTGLSQLIEEIQQHAKTCETAAHDCTEESLTGEASLKDKNTQDARDWMMKSQVWLEAEAVVRGFLCGDQAR